MRNIKNLVLATLTMYVVTTHQSSYAEEKTKSRNIVEHWQNIYLRVDAGKRKYDNKIKGFGRNPKVVKLFGYGLGYNLPWYKMSAEFNIQNSNLHASGVQGNLLRAKTSVSMLSLYKGFSLPDRILEKAPFAESILPYVTGGIGLAYYSRIRGIAQDPGGAHSNSYIISSKNQTAWDIGAGLKFYIGRVFVVDLGYKYMDLGKIPSKINATNGSNTLLNVKSRIRGHQGTASLLMKFW